MPDDLLDEKLLDQIDGALKAATQGRWTREVGGEAVFCSGSGLVADVVTTEADSELIAHAPEWLTALSKRVRHAERLRAAAQAVLRNGGASVKENGEEWSRVRTEDLREMVRILVQWGFEV